MSGGAGRRRDRQAREAGGHPVRSRLGRVLRTHIVFTLFWMVLSPEATSAQSADAGELRAGITLGGTSLVGLSVEFRRGEVGLEASAGTWAFRDLALSGSARLYASDALFAPYAGAGLWAMFGPPGGDGERQARALLLTLPVGVEIGISREDALGIGANFARALALRRGDPTDDTPASRRIVPFPGVWYLRGPR